MRETITINGTAYCYDVAGTPPGALSLTNGVAGACSAPPPPPNVMQTAVVAWSVHGQWLSRNVNTTLLSEITGRLSPNDPPLPWPGAGGSTSRFVIPAGLILAAAFDVPDNINSSDFFSFGGNSYTAGNPPLAPYPLAGQVMPIIVCMSQTPGDFSMPGPFTVRNPVNTDAAYFRYRGLITQGLYAGITPGRWYLNIAGYNSATGQVDTSHAVGVPIVSQGRLNP